MQPKGFSSKALDRATLKLKKLNRKLNKLAKTEKGVKAHGTKDDNC